MLALPAPDAAVEDAPSPAQSPPEDDAELADAQRLLRRAVRKHFPASPHGPAGVYAGVVTKVRRSKSTGAVLWRVRYEDGDREEVERRELLRILVPAALSKGDAAPAASRGEEAAARAIPVRVARIACAPGRTALAPAPRVEEQSGAARDHVGRKVLQPMPDGPRYRGVNWVRNKACWRVQYYMGTGVSPLYCGDFPAENAEDAARAWDKVARKHGRRDVNFPQEGTSEVQCTWGSRWEKRKDVKAKQSWPVPLLQKSQERLTGEQLAPPQVHEKKYAGVSWDRKMMRWRAQVSYGGANVRLGTFPADQAEAAARCFDAAARNLGRTAVNFPIPGSAEVLAVARVRGTKQRSAAGLEREYVGMTREKSGCWRAQIGYGGANMKLGTFPADQAEAAARCFDAAARMLGRPVNFPVPGSGEVQARRAQPGGGLAGGKKRKLPEPSRDLASPPPAKRAFTTPLLMLTAGPATDDDELVTPPEAPEQRLRDYDATPPPASAELQSFIRGIEPPLTQPSAVLRAMHAGSVQLSHLLQLARCMGDSSVSDLAVERSLRAAFQQWGVCVPGDQIALRCALACMPVQR